MARSINEAVARRVAALSKAVDLRASVTITGGVSKNIGVVKSIESLLGIRFTPLPVDPQIVGALGAAVYAAAEAKKPGNMKVAVL